MSTQFKIDESLTSFTWKEKPYALGRLLGRGSFGKVYGLKEDDTMVVKIIKPKNDRHKEGIKREISATNRIRHQNVIHCYDDYFHAKSNTHFILYERIDGNTLDKYIHTINFEITNDIVPESKLLMLKIYLMFQIIDGAVHIHQANITHRDFKPENVMLSRDCDIKIIDFGLCKYSDENRGMNGTRIYNAPELFYPKITQTNQLDEWSIGVTLYKLIFGKHPYAEKRIRFRENDNSHNKKIYKEIRKTLKQTKEKHKNHKGYYNCIKLISGLMKMPVKHRLTVSEALLKKPKFTQNLLHIDQKSKEVWNQILSIKDPSFKQPKLLKQGPIQYRGEYKGSPAFY